MASIYRSIFGMEFSRSSISLLGLLTIFPNLLGAIVIPTPFGFKFHLFQISIFLAAALYGKWGGALSGAFGSIFTAIALNNPFVIFGNAILGFFTGAFSKRLNLISAAMLAFSIQLPWLWYSDIFLAGMSASAVGNIMWVLLFSNLVWASFAFFLDKKMKIREM